MSNDDNVIPFPGDHSSWPDRQGNLPSDPAGIRAFLAGLHHQPFAQPRPKLLRKRPTKVAFIVRLDLDDVRPPVWRRLRLASDLGLPRLHEVIQIAMGWSDCHLHHFVMGPDSRDLRKQPFLGPFDFQEGKQGIAEAEVRLDQVISEPGHRLFYEYDFGDSWWHTIKLEKVEPWNQGDPEASCLGGKRSCPPEDIGGIPGYDDLLEWLAGRTDGHDPEQVKMVLDWLPPDYDPALFSTDAVNDALAADPSAAIGALHPMVANLLGKAFMPLPSELTNLITDIANDVSDEANRLSADEIRQLVRPYQLIIDLVGDGLTLTQAGYLPPRIVERLFTELGMTGEWIGKGNREDQTLPVLELRESATTLGLLRKNRGRLLVTANGRKVAGDPEKLLQFIASKLPLGKDHEKDAATIALLLIAGGENWNSSLGKAADLMNWLGWALQSGSMSDAVNEWSRPTRTVIYALGGRLSPPELKTTIARELLRAGR